jgi:hypothetical protein
VKLWLDDLRRAPGGYVRALTALDAIAILETGLVTFASLDHDVFWPQGYPPDSPSWADEVTGYAVVLWMARNALWPADGVNVHSANPGGSERMKDLIAGHYGPQHHYPASLIYVMGAIGKDT